MIILAQVQLRLDDGDHTKLPEVGAGYQVQVFFLFQSYPTLAFVGYFFVENKQKLIDTDLYYRTLI